MNKSLRSHLNQIRSWVRQGRTDAWVAHQLDVSVKQIERFKQENQLSPEGVGGSGQTAGGFDDGLDLRAEDEKLIAAELEAEPMRLEPEPARQSERPRRRRGERPTRGRRGERPTYYEGTFEHGDEGYGLWLDPAIAEAPIYAEYWAGHRPVEVTISENEITIRRTGEK